MRNREQKEQVELPQGSDFRRITPGDRQLVQDFFAQMGGESRAFFNRNDGNYRAVLRHLDEGTKDKAYFMLEHEGAVIGFVFLYVLEDTIPWLGIAVSEGFKGQGLGRCLIAKMVTYAKELGKAGLLLTTHVANLRGQALYERMGFRHLGTHTSGELLYLLQF